VEGKEAELLSFLGSFFQGTRGAFLKKKGRLALSFFPLSLLFFRFFFIWFKCF